MGDVAISLQFASLYDGQEVVVWSDCLLDFGTDFLVGNMVLYEMLSKHLLLSVRKDYLDSEKNNNNSKSNSNNDNEDFYSMSTTMSTTCCPVTFVRVKNIIHKIKRGKEWGVYKGQHKHE